MGIGDNFDTSVPGLINQRTGRASGHGMLGQDDNGGHPCNVGCGCKPVCQDGIDGGSCLLPPEFRISIIKQSDACMHSNGIKTDDETPEDCESNNGTCLDSEGKVKLDKDNEDYADKKSCETEEGIWETSATWEKGSRKLARSASIRGEGAFESFSLKETFWLRYQNGAWRGRKCCGKSSYDDAGKKLWDMDSDQCDPCDITTLSRCIERDRVARGEEQTDWERSDSEYQTVKTCKGYPDVSDDTKERRWELDTTSTDDCSYYGKSGGHSNRPYIDKNSPLPQKYTLGHKISGKFSLQDLLIEWWGDENPYQPSISVERQHLAHIFRMGSVGADQVIDTAGNPFYSHYKNIIAAGKTRGDNIGDTVYEQCLPDGERFPRINGCMDTDDALVTIPWQVCYKSSCTQSEYTTKSACEAKGGEWNLFVIDDSHAGDNGHETACEEAGHDLYKADIYLDEQQCYELAKCVDSEGEGEEVYKCSDAGYDNEKDCEDNDETWGVISSKWECLERGSPLDNYGVGVAVKNKWTQEWKLLDREDSEAIVTGGVGSDACCGGQGIGDTSPAWISEMKMGRQSTKGQRQNTCITPYKEVTLIPRIDSTSVVDIGGGCAASTSPWQRTEDGYPDIANSGFTVIIKDCDYWGNCYDSSDEGTGEVTVLYIPMDQIMNCTNFRKTGTEWKEQFGWWGNPVGFYPGDPQIDVEIVEQPDGTMSVSPLGGTHLNWCYITDGNDNGQPDWNEYESGTRPATYNEHKIKSDLTAPNFWRRRFKLDGKQPIPYLGGEYVDEDGATIKEGGDALGSHFGGESFQEEIDYDHGTCSVALYWENTLALKPHNARSSHAPGDFALRKLNLQQQPFKATESKQNFYKTLSQAKADKRAFDGCINGNFGSHCPWTGLAYWFEHDFVGSPEDCKKAGEALQKYTRGIEDLTDAGRCLFNPKFTEGANADTNHFEYQKRVCVCDGGIYYRDPNNPESCPATIVDPVATYTDENGDQQYVVHECEKTKSIECDCIRNERGECYGITGPLPDKYDDVIDPLDTCYMECESIGYTGCSDTRYVSFEACMEAGATWGGGGISGQIVRKRLGENVVGRIDCSALASGRPERIATWNIYDNTDKYTDGFGEDLKQFIEPGTPEAMAEGNVWNMKPEVLAIFDAHNLVNWPSYTNVTQSLGGTGEHALDYWGRTGLYPEAANPSYVVNACKAQNTTKAIEYASNTTPIIVRSNRHGLLDGDHVWTYGVQGNFAANVMTMGEWMETQWEDKVSRKCPPKSDCDRNVNPAVVCPCNDGNTYGKDNKHCSGMIIKGKMPPPADFFVAKVVNDDEYALYTCDGQPADGTIDDADCDKEKAGPRICASIFVSPVAVPTAQVEVVTGANGLPIIQEKSPGTSLDSKPVCVEHVNCAVVNPPYDEKWSVMTKPECERLRKAYDGIEVVGNGVEYRPLSGPSEAECGDECFYPLSWMRENDFKMLIGENTGGATSYPACAFTGEWTLRDMADPYTYEGDANALAYRTGWTDLFEKDSKSSKAQDYYVWMHNEETCPACCDHFLPPTLYATVTGDRDQGGSTELYNFFNTGEIATTLHNPDGDKCSDNSGDDQENCKAEWIRGKLETTVPCGINQCTGEMHDDVINYWGNPVGGRYCCDCGHYQLGMKGQGEGILAGPNGGQKCFDCGNALRFDDDRWPDQVTKHAQKVTGGNESGKSYNDFCCDCDCDPGPDASVSDIANLQYPTSEQVMEFADTEGQKGDGCTATLGGVSCAYEIHGQECNPNAAVSVCEDLKNQTDCLAEGPLHCSDPTYRTEAACTGAGKDWEATPSGCEWSDVIGMGEETCNENPGIIYPCSEYNSYCTDDTYVTKTSCEDAGETWREPTATCGSNARCEESGGWQECICGGGDVPCFGFPNGRAMDCEPDLVKPNGPPVGCPSFPRGNWMKDGETEVWTNEKARINNRYPVPIYGCGLPSTGAVPTTDCYDFVPLYGKNNTGGRHSETAYNKSDYKDGCHGMSPRTVRMDYNGSHWVSNWEPMMGDSPRKKELNSHGDLGFKYDAFVGGMSCEHYSTPDKCRFSKCTGGSSDFNNCTDKTSCEGTGPTDCNGYWVQVNKWQPGSAAGNMDMDSNCGDCATNNWNGFKEPPVPTPQHDAHLMRLKMGCGGEFQMYTSKATMLTGDHYRNNQLNMFLEVTHCSYTTCKPLGVMEGYRPPCPNMFELPATRDGTIDDDGTYKVGINTTDQYFSKGYCTFRWHDKDADGDLTIERETDEYCKFPVRADYTWPDGPKEGTTVEFDCDYKGDPPTLEEHPQNTDTKYCYEKGLSYGECVGKEIDPECYGFGGEGFCSGVMVKADEREECVPLQAGSTSEKEWRNPKECNSETQIGKDFCDGMGWTDPYDPYPYYHDCANWNGVISTPGLDCDAQLPCTECCGFNPTLQGERGPTRRDLKGGPHNYVSCASASDLSGMVDTLGIPGSQIPNGKWINSLGGKTPEVFEVVHADVVDDGFGGVAGRLVVRKNSQKACGWAGGTVVSIGMADRNEAETGTYPGTTRDKLSRNPSTDSRSRMKTSLTASIPDGKTRWGVNIDKNSPEYGLPTKLSEYMEIYVKNPSMLFSRANLLEQDLYRGGGRPVSSSRTNEPWPYGDGLWPVGHQSNSRVPSAIADSSQLESIGRYFVRDTRVGFLPTLSNIDDPNRAVFLSDIPKIETNYLDDDTTKPAHIYHNTFNMSLSIEKVENIYDREASFCTNTNYEDQAACEAVGRCELKTEKEDDGSPEFVPGHIITITGTDEAACDVARDDTTWIKTAWWRPKFLYTKITTFEEHDLSDGEKIILSGGQSVTATCEDVPGVQKTSGGANPYMQVVPDLPEGMDMSMIDQVLCEESLGGVWTYDVTDTETIVSGCPPLCELDRLIGKDTCDVNDCGDCFGLLETCLEKDTSASKPVWKENNNLTKKQCNDSGTILRKWRDEEEICPRSSFDGEHVVQLLPDDKKSIIIVAENRSDVAGGALNRTSNFVDNATCSHTIDVNGEVFDITVDECNANKYTNHCYWVDYVGCTHQSECDKLDDHGCKISPFCTHYPAILDDDGKQTEPGHCQEKATAFDPLTTADLQAKTKGALPLVKMGHEVMLGSPKNIYNGEQYTTPTPDDKENYGPYFGSKWSRHGGKFRIRVGQELPLDDCHQGDSSTPTMLHWLFTFPDNICNHYLPIIDADCGHDEKNGSHCTRGYGPYTEEIFDLSRRTGFPAQGLLRIDVHEGSADRHLEGGPDLDTTYPE